MKNILFAFAAFLFAISCNNGPSVNTANLKTDTFKVWGNCGMCKKTIEKSLQVNGVSAADWDKKSKMIEVSYDPALISLAQIQQAIAAAGYDNDGFRGDDTAYENLHTCCHYERKE